MKNWISGITAVLVSLFFTVTVFANELSAVNWLVDQTDLADGSISLDADVANTDQSTHEGALAIFDSDIANAMSIVQSAIGFLANADLSSSSTETISRLTSIKALTGVAQ